MDANASPVETVETEEEENVVGILKISIGFWSLIQRETMPTRIEMKSSFNAEEIRCPPIPSGMNLDIFQEPKGTVTTLSPAEI